MSPSTTSPTIPEDLFVQADEQVNTALRSYTSGILAVQDSIFHIIPLNKDTITEHKQALLALVKSLNDYDRTLGQIVTGWEVGLEIALKN